MKNKIIHLLKKKPLYPLMAFGLIILIVLSICLLGSCNPDEEETPAKKEYYIVDEDLTTKQTEEETVEISPESTEEETTIEETVPETMQETVVETTPETIEETIMVDTRYNLSMENLYLTESLPAEYEEFWSSIMDIYLTGERDIAEVETTLTYNQINDMFTNYIDAIPVIQYSGNSRQFVTSYEEVNGVCTPTIYFKEIDNAITASNLVKTKVQDAIYSIGLNSNWKEEDAANAISDYVVNMTDYDYSYTRTDIEDAFTGTATCGGYARAYQVIAKSVGLPCDYIVGNTPEGYHAWNRVLVDGKWKYYDCTWNDTAGENRWKGISEIEMNQDHFPEKYDS